MLAMATPSVVHDALQCFSIHLTMVMRGISLAYQTYLCTWCSDVKGCVWI